MLHRRASFGAGGNAASPPTCAVISICYIADAWLQQAFLWDVMPLRRHKVAMPHIWLSK